MVARRYIDFLILLIPTPLVSALFCNSILLFVLFLMFLILVTVHFVIYLIIFSRSVNTHTGDYGCPTEAI